MTTGQKTTFSLLISTLLFGIFAFVAFSDLFRIIEITFYNTRTTQEITKRLEKLSQGVEFYKSDTTKALEFLVTDPTFQTVFNPTQSREDIQSRANSLSVFFRSFRGPASLRVLDNNLDKIHFSTIESDVLTKNDFSLTYKNYKSLKDQFDLSLVLNKEQKSKVVSEKGTIVFFQPMKDTTEVVAGWAVMSLGIEDIRAKLFEKGDVTVLENFYFLSPEHLVLSFAGVLDAKLQDRAIQVLSSPKVLPVETFAQLENDMTLLLLTLKEGQNISGAVIPQDFLKLNWILKIIILASGFSVIFLVVFFFFNFRSDPVVALNRKVKRFQIQVIKGYLDEKSKNPSTDLLTNLIRNSDKIKQEIHSGIGKVRKKDKTWATELINKSWDDILEILGAKKKAEEPAAAITADRIEKIIKEALQKGHFSISATPGPISSPLVKSSTQDEELEELDELPEQLEELEELGESTEPVEQVKASAKQSEEKVEDLEELYSEDPLEAGAQEPEELEMLPSDEYEEADEVLPLEDSDEPSTELVPVVALEKEMAEAQAIEDGVEEVLETLEPDFNDHDDAEEVELLDTLDDEGAFYQSGDFSPQVSGKLGVLAATEDQGDAEEMEELEDSDEAGMAVAINPEVSSKHQAVRVFTLTEITEYYLTHTLQAFNVQDNVLQISDEYFKNIKTKADPVFASLVDSVMGPSVAVKEVPGSTIVSPHFVGFDEDEEDTGPKVWRWTGEGFDLDKFLTYYKTAETGLYKALIDLTTGFEAFAGALLLRDDKGLVGAHSVGFSDQGKEHLNFGPGHELFDEFLADDAMFLFDGEPGHNRYLYKNLHPKDLRYIRAVIFAPVIYKHKQGYLLMAYKAYPHQPLELLRPRDL